MKATINGASAILLAVSSVNVASCMVATTRVGGGVVGRTTSGVGS